MQYSSLLFTSECHLLLAFVLFCRCLVCVLLWHSVPFIFSQPNVVCYFARAVPINVILVQVSGMGLLLKLFDILVNYSFALFSSL